MKIKQFVSISNTKAFLEGGWDSCFAISGYKCSVPDWLNNFAEIEFDVPDDANEKCRALMFGTLEKQEEELRAKLNLIEIAKVELMSLEHKE